MVRWLLLAIVLCACSSPSRGKVELVDAPAAADVAPLIASELAKASRDGKQLVVYVGATWCEPCQRFHEAAAAGELDGQLGTLRLLVFDQDRDSSALVNAGYISEMIPLFAIPRPDGRASGNQIEGGIKGGGAVAQITPRLQKLIAR